MKGNGTDWDEELFASMEELLAEGHEIVFTPKGRSMLPFIRGERDSVAMHKVPQEELGVGDVVLAKTLPAGRRVMHRIIHREGMGLTLMGDGNVRGTEKTTVDLVMAKVTHVLRDKDPEQRRPLGKAKFWRAIRPLRRYILAIYRRLPWVHIP